MRIFWAGSIAILAACIAVQAGAELSAPSPTGIQPKRVGVPKPGTKRFLTIQIDPEEQRRALETAAAKPFVPVTRPPDAPVAPAGPSPYDWYWDAVSPSLNDKSGRFSKAVAALAQGPGGKSVAFPRLSHMQKIAEKHGADILAATIGTEVSPALVLAVIGIESGGRVDAVSSAGAVGLMQLIPATAARFKVTDSSDPVQNIKGGVAYLDWLMKEFDRDPLMVIAAYNSGENAVKKNGGVPPYAETRGYVPKVLAAWTIARGLCRTPPELVTDGCVFAVKG